MDPFLSELAETPRAVSRTDLVRLLEWPDAKELFAAAYAVKVRESGRSVSLRGLVECGNVCAKNCLYCGIRRGNAGVRRYRMPEDEILRRAGVAFEAGFGNLVLQSGELESEENTAFFESVLAKVRSRFGGKLEAGELGLRVSQTGAFLPCGASSRWFAEQN